MEQDVTLVFTDAVEGATTLAARVEAQGGAWVGRADGAVAVLDSADDALALARSLVVDGGAEPLPRVGLHRGPPSLHRSPAEHVARGASALNVDGLVVAIAARLRALARPGQVLLTREAVPGGLSSGDRVVSHGQWRLKGARQPIEVVEVVGADDPVPAPPLDGPKAYRVIHDGERWLPARDVPHTLPAEWDRFVGRGRELDLLVQVAEHARLISLTGMGGSGKTRLALHFGWTHLGAYAGGVWFCDVSPARDAIGVARAVAAALDVPLAEADPVEQLGHALAARGACLVILDNLEQVAEHAEETVGRWTALAPAATFVVTSRETLGLPGEETLALAPLPADDSLALFEARARAVRPGFSVGASDLREVEALVALLDHLPLAIELAAARVRVMPPAKLLARMTERFKVLTSSGTRHDRHATLRATIDWSWELLSEAEQRLLAELAVFEGGFGDDALTAVATAAEGARGLLASLVSRSLVRRRAPGRHDLLGTVQSYAAERLHGFGAQVATEERHARWFTQPGLDGAAAKLRIEGRAAEWYRLAKDLDNVVVATRRSASRGAAELAVAGLWAAWTVLERQGPTAFAAQLAAEVERPAASGDRARASYDHVRGLIDWRIGAVSEGRSRHEAALGGFQALGDARGEGMVRTTLARLAADQGDTDEAQTLLSTARALHEAAGDRLWVAVAETELGLVTYARSRWDAAAEHFAAALDTFRECGHELGEGLVLNKHGVLWWRRGDRDQAAACFRTALEISRSTGSKRDESMALSNLGLLLAQDLSADADECFEAALSIHRHVGDRRSEAIVLTNLGTLRRKQGRLEEARSNLLASKRIYSDIGDRQGVGFALTSLGSVSFDQGRLDDAAQYQADALRVRQEIGDRDGEGRVLGNLGAVRFQQGNHAEARAHYEAALTIHRELGNRTSEANVRTNLGAVLTQEGLLDPATSQLHAALGIARQARHRPAEADALDHLAIVDLARGALDDALRHLEASLQIHQDLGQKGAEGSARCLLGNVDATAGRHAEARAAWDAGAALLRDTGSKLLLGMRLADRVVLEATWDPASARQPLAEVEAIAEELAPTPQSELGRRLADARAALDGGSDEAGG